MVPWRLARQGWPIISLRNLNAICCKGSSVAALHYHASLMRHSAMNPCTRCIIWMGSSTHAVIRGSLFGASSYKAHVTLKLVSLDSLLGSCLDIFHSFQSNARQRAEPERGSTFWDFSFASVKQSCNWQLGYSSCVATLVNVRGSQEVKSLYSRHSHYGRTERCL